MRCERRKRNRKPDAQQKSPAGAGSAGRAGRLRQAAAAEKVATGPAPRWVGCQWLYEGYCGRAKPATAVTPAARADAGADDEAARGDTVPPPPDETNHAQPRTPRARRTGDRRGGGGDARQQWPAAEPAG